MDTIYLLPGEERCVDFRDVNGIPKVHYIPDVAWNPDGLVRFLSAQGSCLPAAGAAGRFQTISKKT